MLFLSFCIIYIINNTKKATLVLFFLTGIIHLESFGQSSQNTEPPQASQVMSTDSTTTIIPDFIIYFRVDKSNIDPSYMNNAAILERMSNIVAQENLVYIDSLIISAYASPEAPSAYNKRLSERRANAVRNYFLKKFPLLQPAIVHAYGYGENWEGLRQLVAADSQVPQKSEVLRIIDSNLSEDQREQKLKALQGGTVYRYIYKNFYPRLRVGASLKVMLATTAPMELQALVSMPAIKPPAIQIESLPVSLPTIEFRPIIPVEYEKVYNYPLSFRTNLLFDAVGILNIGAELPFGKKKNWSLQADFAYSFWHSSNDLYALQTLEYGLESRYWFGVKEARKIRKPNWAEPLKGFYVGIYGRYWERYDVQFIDGYQGDDSWSVGLTTGYVVPLNRSLSLDFGVGAGWFSTSQYRHYHEPEYNEHGTGHLMWQQTGSWSGLSLTKIQLSLVWIIRTSKIQQKGGNK